ncbi:MAG: cache domain-containing protein, partial [Chloroflexota bacterium]
MATTPGPAPRGALLKFLEVRDWRIGPKLIGAFLPVVILSLALVGYVSVSTSRDALLKQGTINLNAISASTSRAIDEYLFAQRQDIVTLRNSSDIIAFALNPNNETTRANALKVLQATDKKHYESVAIVNLEGVITLSSSLTDVGNNVKSSAYFAEAVRGVTYISDPSISVISNRPAIFFSAPIFGGGGNILGVLRSRLSLDGIWDLVENDKDAAGLGTIGLLLDENGIRLATSWSLNNRDAVTKGLLYKAVSPLSDATEKQFAAERRFGNSAAASVPVIPLPEVGAALRDSTSKVFESTADNSTVRHTSSIAVLKNKPWRYVVMAPIPTFTSAADNLTLQLIIIGLFVTVATSVAVVILARNFTQPIVHLTQVADRISLGELDIQIEIDRKDEIGDLAQAIGRLQAGLQATMDRLRAR